jgi:hypothetical protein
MKICSKCELKKELVEFYRDKSRICGRKSACAVCTRLHAKIYRINNRDRLNAHSRKWHQENKDHIKKRSKEWREANPEKSKAQKKRYREKYKEQISKKMKEWIKNNPRKERVYSEKQKERIKIKKKEWKQNNKGLERAYSMKRYAKKLKATPKWLSDCHYKNIEQIYIEARNTEKLDGIPRHVDHIIPLQGKNVSGLHVPWNLQILTKKENLKKSNKILDRY